ncbi:Mariner Mos1 transposase [Eumeta japonica]|uniref:Mariner Mos1 transposase n=2 Tax=Eumeta variegata TaxID=151549 RepID=A0A4C1VTA8_EUMVA|nr:Mariner Mos1 transposase [Eumeta japonica]
MTAEIRKNKYPKRVLEFPENLPLCLSEAIPTLMLNILNNIVECNDFDVRNKERGRPPKKFEDVKLQAILDEDDTLSQKQMADMLNVAQQTISDRLKAMGKIQKCGKWVPHELNERQMENRKNTCEILLQRHERKSVLHRIVTGDEKWIYFKNPKRRKSWVNPGQPSASTAKPDRFGKKAMLCVWWDQKGVVYYELLKPGETVNTSRYKQQMIDLNNALIEKRPEWARRHGKVILLHDNAPAHKAKEVQDTIKVLGWELLPHPPYSPDLAPSDYHLFSSMGHALAEQRFDSYAEVENWVSDWFASKEEHFYWHGIHKLPKRWTKCVESDGQYFE